MLLETNVIIILILVILFASTVKTTVGFGFALVSTPLLLPILDLTIINTSDVVDIKNVNYNQLKIIDVLGRESSYRKNTLLFYIYDNGTIQKRIIFE